MSRRLGKDTVKLVMPGDKTVHGNVTDDWSNPVLEVEVKRCYVELSVTAEDLVHRDADLAAGTVFAPPGLTVHPRMKVVYLDTDYAIDGRALEAHSFSGAIDYIPIPIKRWEGS